VVQWILCLSTGQIADWQIYLPPTASEYIYLQIGVCVSVAECVQGAGSAGLLGLSTGQIADWQISASSTFPTAHCNERHARLLAAADGHGWCARYKAPTEWLQIDLGLPALVIYTPLFTEKR